MVGGLARQDVLRDCNYRALHMEEQQANSSVARALANVSESEEQAKAELMGLSKAKATG